MASSTNISDIFIPFKSHYLLENYINYTSLSRVLDINPKVLRDFILLGRTPQDAKFYVIRKKVKFIMKQMKDAEIYDPSPL